MEVLLKTLCLESRLDSEEGPFVGRVPMVEIAETKITKDFVGVSPCTHLELLGLVDLDNGGPECLWKADGC